MNTGHEGSLTTIHANSPRDALSRLENMVLMAGFELPVNYDVAGNRLSQPHAQGITIVRYKNGHAEKIINK